MRSPATVADTQQYETDTLVEWAPKNDLRDVQDKPNTVARVVSTYIGGLDDGSHLLRLCGVEFILWVDHRPAFDDRNRHAQGWQITDLDLRAVTGPNALMHCDPVNSDSTSPYRTVKDGNSWPTLRAAADRVASSLVAHTIRTGVAR